MRKMYFLRLIIEKIIMQRQQLISSRIQQALTLEHLEVINESDNHMAQQIVKRILNV